MSTKQKINSRNFAEFGGRKKLTSRYEKSYDRRGDYVEIVVYILQRVQEVRDSFRVRNSHFLQKLQIIFFLIHVRKANDY